MTPLPLPRNPDIERRVLALVDELRDEWEERAAIIQFAAGVTREAAERWALERIEARLARAPKIRALLRDGLS